jgi:hypothetical protein
MAFFCVYFKELNCYVQSIALSGLGRQTELIAPLLYDPVAAVRMEAASALAGEPSKGLSPDQSCTIREVKTTTPRACSATWLPNTLNSTRIHPWANDHPACPQISFTLKPKSYMMISHSESRE